MNLKGKMYLTASLSAALLFFTALPYYPVAATEVNAAMKTSTDSVAPTSPQNLTAFSKTASTIGLIWDKSSDDAGVKGYDIYENGSKIGSSDYLKQYDVAKTNYTVTGLKPNTKYKFKVVARDASGNVSKSSKQISVITSNEGKIFNVKDYGAVGDGVTKDSKAIQDAIDACTPGGVVVIPAGTYYTAPLKLKSDMTLNIEKGATILASRDVSDYKIIDSRWEGTSFKSYMSIITAIDAKNLNIIGEGTIDGNAGPIKEAAAGETEDAYGYPVNKVNVSGEYDYNMGKYNGDKSTAVNFDMGLWWDNPKATDPTKQTARPRTIQLINCDGVLIQGVKVQNSPSWTIHPLYSKNITIADVNVKNPSSPVDSPNTDGLDPDSVDNLLVVNTTFDVGDDCIAIKSGKDAEGRKIGIPSSNITIRNSLMLHGHGGVTLGSEMSGGINNINIKDDIFDSTNIGVRLKTLRGRGGVIQDVVFDNIMMKNISSDAFNINSNYSSNGAPLPYTGVVDETTPTIKNLVFKNITAIGAKEASFFQGLQEMPVDGVTLSNINVTADKGLFAQYVKNVKMDHVNINNGNMFQADSTFDNLQYGGIIDGVKSFNGNENSTIKLPSNLFNSSKGSITAWVNSGKNFKSESGTIMYGKSNDSANNYSLSFTKDKKVQFNMKVNSKTVNFVTNDKYNGNAWHKITVTWDAKGEEKLYIDGKVKASDTVNLDTAAISDISYIGKSDNLSEYYKGDMKDINIYNYVISPEEITSK
ncbi:glycosyl hydrolase family 28 protein [Clostridium arbusti]|uniref:glycosyl hydrolase family 28 protein n=1 Tax=Clostridium arbusti TaxID=1137848 RepID=UPI000289D701|nr:glycosyl hydrolase family 28 protein [Clostridium arbusti]